MTALRDALERLADEMRDCPVSHAYHGAQDAIVTEWERRLRAIAAHPVSDPRCKTCGNFGCMGDVDAADRAKCSTLRAPVSDPAPEAPRERGPAEEAIVGTPSRSIVGRCPCGGELVQYTGARTPQAQCLKCKEWRWPGAPSPVQGEAPRCACGDPECRAKGVWWCNTCTEPMGPACGSHDVAWRPAVQGAETGTKGGK